MGIHKTSRAAWPIDTTATGLNGSGDKETDDERIMRAKPLITAALAALLATSPALVSPAVAGPAAAEVKSGVDAWTRGDYAGAIHQWEGPAARGDADAQFNLAQAYKLGKGVPRDMKKAEDLYALAASQGHLQAADNYGLLLFQTTRQAEALPWLKASAERGEPRAMYILGVAHFNGDFVNKDWVRAYALMSRAAASGLPQATASLATMDTMIPIEQRQLGVSLAADLEQQAQSARSRQFAAADLGARPGTPTMPMARVSAPTPAPLRPTAAVGPLATAAIPPSDLGRSAITGAPLTEGPAAQATAPPAQPRRIVVAPKGMMPPLATSEAKASAAAAAAEAAAARPTPPKAAAPRPTSSGGWRVQLGAFGQKGNADAMWNRVKARPEIAGHARVDVPVGTIAKLQASGYATQAEAERACAALKATGTTCIAVKS
jgi:TPR repeat protein